MEGYRSRLDRGMRQRFSTELEDMVDKSSVAEVLDIIGDMLSEKADHIRTNGDSNTAARWERASGQLIRLIDLLPNVTGIRD